MAENRQRMTDEPGREMEDVEMVAADGESNWIDDDRDELKRERNKAGRRYLREREREEKNSQQPANQHNHRLQSAGKVGMVKFEPSTFDGSVIDDRSERHALLSPLTEDEDEEEGTESGSSSEFECSDDDDDDSSGGEPSSSSSDDQCSKLVDDKYDDKKIQRRKEARRKAGKKRSTKVVEGGSRVPRVQANTRDRWDSDQSESEEDASEPVRSFRRPAAAPTHRVSSAKQQKQHSVSAFHTVAAMPPATQQNSIAFSALSSREKDDITRIAQHLRGFTVLPDHEADAASHVLVESRKPTRTRKVLFGIARGSWILDRQWLFEYVGLEGQLLNFGADGLAELEQDEMKYEVDCWPGAKQSRVLHKQGGRTLVFDRGDKIFVAGRTALARPYVEQLIHLVGGQPVSNYFNSSLCICADDFVIADLDERLVGQPSAAFSRLIVTAEWLYDCICEGVRKPLDGYKRYPYNDMDVDGQVGEEEARSPAL